MRVDLEPVRNLAHSGGRRRRFFTFRHSFLLRGLPTTLWIYVLKSRFMEEVIGRVGGLGDVLIHSGEDGVLVSTPPTPDCVA